MVSAKSKWRAVDLAYTALFAVLMMVCAWITVPLTVPFTLQTFGVFAALGTLGGRRGTYAVAAYLLLGLAGLPVFRPACGGTRCAAGHHRRVHPGVPGLGPAVLGRHRPAGPAARCDGGGHGAGAGGVLRLRHRLVPGGLRPDGGLHRAVAALGMCVLPLCGAGPLAKIALAMLLSRQLAPQLR